MRLHRVAIRNFRALAEVEIELDPRLTVLVGANNAGKTSLLDAIGAVLGFRGGLAFTELDFRSTDAGDPARRAPPIQVDVVVAPSTGPKFVAGELGQHTPQVLASGEERFLLRLETKWSNDPSILGLESTLTVLRNDGQALGTLRRFPFSEYLPHHSFGGERDLRRGLSNRWSDWARIIAEARPNDDVRKKVMSRLRAASRYLMRNTPALEDVRSALGEAGTVTGIGAMDVKLSAAPEDVDELLRRVGIELRLPGAGRAFGAERHGLGTQGALLFAIYRLEAERLRRGRPTVSPVMTIEEPEAHLHPTAQRALAMVLADLPGQVIVTSHSPELLSKDGRAVLLRNSDGTTELRARPRSPLVAQHPRALFARCVVIAEGLEGAALDLCARSMHFDLHQRGVEVIDARGQTNIVALWRTFGPDGFDLPVVCVADADVPGNLDAFLKALVETGRIASTPAGTAIYRVLRENAYFVPKPGRNLEETLVDDYEADVDAAIHQLTSGETFVSWRAAMATNKVGKRCKRYNGLRTVRQAPLDESKAVVADLSDREARYFRLGQDKKLVPEVLRLLTRDGTDSTRIPLGYRHALRCIDRHTRARR